MSGAGVRFGWLTTAVPNPPPARGMVFVLRGQGAVFSRGSGRLCDRLRAAGVWAEDLRCVGDAWAVREVLRRRAGGERVGPVAFVGHSRGGRRALVAARRLGALGVPVDLVVCLDVAFPPAVPGTVRRAVHLFQGGWRAYPARPLRAEFEALTVVENIDWRSAGSPVGGRGLHHLNVTADPTVGAWVAGQVLAACGAADGPAPG